MKSFASGITFMVLAVLMACTGCSSGGSSYSAPPPDIHWHGEDSRYDNTPTQPLSGNAGHTDNL